MAAETVKADEDLAAAAVGSGSVAAEGELVVASVVVEAAADWAAADWAGSCSQTRTSH